MKPKHLKTLCLFLMPLILSCCKDDDPPTRYEVNENIVEVVKETWYGLVNHPCAVWSRDNRIYTSWRISCYTLDDNFKMKDDSVISKFEGRQFIEISDDHSKILYVNSKYTDVSVGGIREMSLDSLKIKETLDSTHNISSAVYYRDTSQLIYYTYGNPVDTLPGYYLYNKQTRKKQLLLEYISPLGPSEYLNGFDLHPKKEVLIIPLMQMGKSPKIIEYDFTDKQSDTLEVPFDFSVNRICLWLRYNKAGTKILYSCYPMHAGGAVTNDDSEVGIIDRETLNKHIFDVHPYKRRYRSVNICPNWSPDEKQIVYASADVTIEGYKGSYGIYILKNIEY